VFSSRSDQTLDWVLLLSNLSLHWKGVVKIKRPVIKTIMADLNSECLIVYDIWSETTVSSLLLFRLSNLPFVLYFNFNR
jgi:hypothetical protein